MKPCLKFVIEQAKFATKHYFDPLIWIYGWVKQKLVKRVNNC